MTTKCCSSVVGFSNLSEFRISSHNFFFNLQFTVKRENENVSLKNLLALSLCLDGGIDSRKRFFLGLLGLDFLETVCDD